MTGRELIARLAGDERIADELRKEGFVCVPVQPTEDMINAAWADANEEDAVGVWRTMIGVAEGDLTREGIPVR